MMVSSFLLLVKRQICFIFTLFDSSGRIEFSRFDLRFGQVEGRSQELSRLHVQNQLLHLPVGGSTDTLLLNQRLTTNIDCLHIHGLHTVLINNIKNKKLN